MSLVGVQLNAKQQDELKEAFIIYDNDGDQKVTREQAECVIRSIGIAPTNDQLSKMLGGSQFYSLHDIQSIIASKAPAFETEATLQEAIRLFDKNGNGYLDAKEFRHVVTNLGDKMKDDEVDEITREMDISGDNQISCDGFVSTIRSVI